MTVFKFSDLPFPSRLSLWWSFVWRSVVIAIGSSLGGALVGGIAGVVLGLAGRPGAVTGVALVLGAVCGCVFIYLYVHWLLSSRLGRFRLLIVRADEAAAPRASAALGGEPAGVSSR